MMSGRLLVPVISALIEFVNIKTDPSACPELVKRLLSRDATLWSDHSDTLRRIENRLGWLDPAAFMDRHLDRIVRFTHTIRNEGYQQAVLLGMGGSSLAPEVYAALFSGSRDSIPVVVADSTSPHHVHRLAGDCERTRTLFIVSSKSGTTAETTALDAFFFNWAQSRFQAPGEHFIAITDPGSPLQRLAEERGYREVFLNPPDIGGRFSALSFFGLVPASLAGTHTEAIRSRLPDPGDDTSLLDACRLGQALGSLALGGRNKLTLCFSRRLSPLAAWVEQLVDESTGKNGAGIVVIPGEVPAAPNVYTDDRVFVVVDFADDPADESWVNDLSSRGHPVARWRLADIEQIGAHFYMWQIATSIGGRILGINPFDEPDVADSKDTTRDFLEHPDRARGEASRPSLTLAELLSETRPGDYIAILAFLPPTAETEDRLNQWCTRLARYTGLPCCWGFGPRYLHSSGQLHKGGPDQGVFIVVTHDTDFDLPIPGQRHGFRSLVQAQARGDVQVLRDRGRRVAHLEIDDPVGGLDELMRSAV